MKPHSKMCLIMNLLNFPVNGSILYGPFAGCFESLSSLKAGGFFLFFLSVVSHMVGKGLPADDSEEGMLGSTSRVWGLQPEALERTATCQVLFLLLTHLIFTSTL